MRGFIDKNGNYYEAENLLGAVYDEQGTQIGGPVEVPLRPSFDDVFDAATKTWKPKILTLDEVKAREKAQVSTIANNKLGRVDDAVRRMVVLMAEAKAVPPTLIAKVKKNDQIEDVRDAAIVAIDAATTKAAVNAIVPALVWP